MTQQAGDDAKTAVEIVERAAGHVSSGFASAAEDVFGDDFVFHYFNDRLPNLAGDYRGLDGMRSFFEQLDSVSGGNFNVEPHSLTPFGDELVAAYVTITLSIGGDDLELDALMLWRVFAGQVHEAWDIPAVNTVRSPSAPAAERD